MLNLIKTPLHEVGQPGGTPVIQANTIQRTTRFQIQKKKSQKESTVKSAPQTGRSIQRC